MMFEETPQYPEVFRYGLAGLFNTATGWLLFPAVYTIFPKWYVATLILCNVVTVTQSYVLSAYFVFRGSRKNFHAYAMHSGLYWFALVVSIVVVPVAKELFGIDPRITFFLFCATMVPVGYLWQKFVVFKSAH
jgi:putative flippase GtrA